MNRKLFKYLLTNYKLMVNTTLLRVFSTDAERLKNVIVPYYKKINNFPDNVKISQAVMFKEVLDYVIEKEKIKK